MRLLPVGELLEHFNSLKPQILFSLSKWTWRQRENRLRPGLRRVTCNAKKTTAKPNKCNERVKLDQEDRIQFLFYFFFKNKNSIYLDLGRFNSLCHFISSVCSLSESVIPRLTDVMVLFFLLGTSAFRALDQKGQFLKIRTQRMGMLYSGIYDSQYTLVPMWQKHHTRKKPNKLVNKFDFLQGGSQNFSKIRLRNLF